VVTVVDLDDQPATPLAQPLASASCPSVDPGGGSTLDCYGNLFHFDTWERQWAAWCSPWLGRELGDLSDDVEQALLTWPSQPLPGLAGDGLPDPALVDLAWMTFLGLHHEMMWNKEALESRRVNECFGVLSPEDFVVAASLQLRNALVHLHAAVWSAWAAGQPAGAATWVDGGPVLDLLVQAGRAGAGGLHWDADLLQNDVLYNREVLAVLDRNGGRITHLFTRRPGAGGALCLSGTPKAYQWTTPVRRPGEREEDWVTCDGGVLENTVLTPNHLYVASDLDLAAARPGWRHEDRARQVSPQPWLYPDVFDEYESVPDQATGSVRYRYGPPRGPQPSDAVEGSAFHEACVQDRRARLDGVGTPVVWHREGLDLAKTITLAGRRLTVDYDRAPPGHRVANEFCIDVRRALTGDPVQQRRSGRTWVEVSAPGGAGARVTAAAGCRVDGVSRLTDPDAARAAGQLAEFRRLHRVLTDAVVVECPDGGALRYTIDLKHA
jgi:hypothetical protein